MTLSAEGDKASFCAVFPVELVSSSTYSTFNRFISICSKFIKRLLLNPGNYCRVYCRGRFNQENIMNRYALFLYVYFQHQHFLPWRTDPSHRYHPRLRYHCLKAWLFYVPFQITEGVWRYVGTEKSLLFC